MRRGRGYNGMGRYSRRPVAGPSYGPELIVNGGFATSADWGVSTGVSISGGKLNFIAAANDFSAFQEGDILNEATIYKVVFTIDSIAAGGIRIQLDSESFGTTRTTAGTFTEEIPAGFAEGVTIQIMAVGAATSAVVDNVSVMEVL